MPAICAVPTITKFAASCATPSSTSAFAAAPQNRLPRCRYRVAERHTPTACQIVSSAAEAPGRPEDDEIEATAAAAAATPAKPKPLEVRLRTIDELVEFFIAAGKKGVAINRYKGLGEMNPEQLWETTMDPGARTLLQVRAEDHTEADLMFTTLMGDQVEPRRKFIEDNALDVKNLDV